MSIVFELHQTTAILFSKTNTDFQGLRGFSPVYKQPTESDFCTFCRQKNPCALWHRPKETQHNWNLWLDLIICQVPTLQWLVSETIYSSLHMLTFFQTVPQKPLSHIWMQGDYWLRKLPQFSPIQLATIERFCNMLYRRKCRKTESVKNLNVYTLWTGHFNSRKFSYGIRFVNINCSMACNSKIMKITEIPIRRLVKQIMIHQCETLCTHEKEWGSSIQNDYKIISKVHC